MQEYQPRHAALTQVLHNSPMDLLLSAQPNDAHARARLRRGQASPSGGEEARALVDTVLSDAREFRMRDARAAETDSDGPDLLLSDQRPNGALAKTEFVRSLRDGVDEARFALGNGIVLHRHAP
jgi:hypothetical protein